MLLHFVCLKLWEPLSTKKGLEDSYVFCVSLMEWSNTKDTSIFCDGNEKVTLKSMHDVLRNNLNSLVRSTCIQFSY